jgi:hypothetical protein
VISGPLFTLNRHAHSLAPLGARTPRGTILEVADLAARRDQLNVFAQRAVLTVLLMVFAKIRDTRRYFEGRKRLKTQNTIPGETLSSTFRF